jgi:aspartate/methionine/tyrosine aminotransferase
MPKRKLPNQEAFDFLGQCPKAKFDFSASQAFPKKNLIIFLEEGSQLHEASRGDDETLKICCEFFKKHKIDCDTKNIALLKDGILDAIVKTYRFLDLEREEEVLVAAPTFGYYLQQLIDARVNFSIISSKKQDGFLPNLDEMEKIFQQGKVKVLLLCYPNNPTGAIMTQEYAQKLADLVKKYDIFVISDEIFLMNNLETALSNHFPLAAVDGMIERSLTLTSTTKAIGHSDFRMGFCVGRKELVDSFAILGGHSKSYQTVLLADLLESGAHLETSRQKYLENRDIVKLGIAFLNDGFCKKFGEDKEYVKLLAEPSMGNVLVLDFSGLSDVSHEQSKLTSGLDVAKWMLEEAGVAMVPGECFLFEPNEMVVRIALGYPKEQFIEAFEALNKAIDKLHKMPENAVSTPEFQALAPNIKIPSKL